MVVRFARGSAQIGTTLRHDSRARLSGTTLRHDPQARLSGTSLARLCLFYVVRFATAFRCCAAREVTGATSREEHAARRCDSQRRSSQARHSGTSLAFVWGVSDAIYKLSPAFEGGPMGCERRDQAVACALRGSDGACATRSSCCLCVAGRPMARWGVCDAIKLSPVR